MIAGGLATKGLAIISTVVLMGAYVSYRGGILRLPRGWGAESPAMEAGRDVIAHPMPLPTKGAPESWAHLPSGTGAFSAVHSTELTPPVMMSGSKSGPVVRPEDLRLPEPRLLNDGIVTLQKPVSLQPGTAAQPVK